VIDKKCRRPVPDAGNLREKHFQRS